MVDSHHRWPKREETYESIRLKGLLLITGLRILGYNNIRRHVHSGEHNKENNPDAKVYVCQRCSEKKYDESSKIHIAR